MNKANERLKAIAKFHDELASLSALLETEYSADIRILSSSKQFYPKHIITAPNKLANDIEMLLEPIHALHAEIKEEFDANRAITMPRFFLNTSYASLTINAATSVQKLGKKYNEFKSELQRIITYAADRKTKTSAEKALNELQKVHPDELRLVSSTGLNFQLAIYDSLGHKQRSNVNHMAILISASDACPLIQEQHIRQRRSDIKERIPVCDFIGGYTLNNKGIKEWAKPIKVYYK